jgi:hypothetical protein
MQFLTAGFVWGMWDSVIIALLFLMLIPLPVFLPEKFMHIIKTHAYTINVTRGLFAGLAVAVHVSQITG